MWALAAIALIAALVLVLRSESPLGDRVLTGTLIIGCAVPLILRRHFRSRFRQYALLSILSGVAVIYLTVGGGEPWWVPFYQVLAVWYGIDAVREQRRRD